MTPVPVAPGLCSTCSWMRRITTRTGSAFIYCRLSESDPDFPRYPALPVVTCAGYRKLVVETGEQPDPSAQ